MADICRTGDNTLSSRTVPIIFVPGVMGSKLHFPNIKQNWDPDSKVTAMTYWLGVSAEGARVDLGIESPAEVYHSGDPPNTGWGGVSVEFYSSFLFFLNGLKTLCAKTPVYAFAYDWRQSNFDSGAKLNSRISKILDFHQAKNFVLISHSMGGIVCRSCLKENKTNADKLLGVIHIFQPASGAPVFYGRMYTGAVGEWDGGTLPAMLMGNDADDFAILMSGLRGPCELSPTEAYVDRSVHNVRGPWLWDKRDTRTLKPFPAPIYDRYLETTGPPGVCWSIAGTDRAHDLQTRLLQAKRFHARLSQYRHPKTWALYGTGRETDVATHFYDASEEQAEYTRLVRGIHRERRNEGDGTVPRSSGAALFGPSATRSDVDPKVFSADSSLRQCEVSGVDHAAACASSKVQAVVEQMLLVIFGCCGPIKEPSDSPHADSTQQPAGAA